MNAYEIEQAAFDSACDYAEETIAYVQNYADGAFGLDVSTDIAQKILDCRAAYKAAVEADGQYSLHHDQLVKNPLKEIEL